MRLAARRRPAAAARLARVIWLAWAIVVWNVVFDHVIVVAGRAYIDAASRAVSAQSTTTAPLHYENMDDWMRPAVTRGLVIATGSALLIAVPGLLLVGRASRRQVTACA